MADASVNEEMLPPYVDAGSVDLNIKTDLNTAATIVGTLASLVIIGAYLDFNDG